MILKTFLNAAGFLREARAVLEANEAANNLMYGLALRLLQHPERIKIPPYFGVVRHKRSLQAAALMTPPHNLIVFAADPQLAGAAFELVADSLRQEAWPVPGVLGPNQAALAFAQAWQQRTGAAPVLTTRERVYELRQVLPPPAPGGHFRPATLDDLPLVARWVWEFHIEAVPGDPGSPEEILEANRVKIGDGDLFLWEDSQPVALAGRSRATPHGCCIGPVYTPPAFRRRGYATALTAALSQLLLDSGKQFTALFTDLANPISNSIYQQIGYRPVCDFDLYKFDPAKPVLKES